MGIQLRPPKEPLPHYDRTRSPIVTRIPYAVNQDMRRLEVCSGVYCISDVTDNSVYVGQSEWIPYRWENHLNLLYLRKHHVRMLQFDFCAFGPNVLCFIALEKCEGKEARLDREQFWIEYFRREGRTVHNSK